MTKVALIALLAGVVSITTGCAFSWVKDGVNEEDTQRDLARCQHKMEVDSVKGGYEQDYVRQQQLLRFCMQEEGYERKQTK